MFDQKMLKNLICLQCRGELNFQGDKLICQKCSKIYPIKENIPYLIEEEGNGFTEGSYDVLINKLKIVFKKYPALFNILYYCFGASFVGKSAKKAIENFGEDKIILNLGSGAKVIRKDIINIDFYPFANMNIIADIAKLPFKDNSVDAIICESVLEHVKDPYGVVKEMRRVLKPGGLVYVTVPFIASFHSSPNDYYRWSREGLRAMLQGHGFKEKEVGIRHGPTSAVLSVMNDWLATIFSFGSSQFQQFLLIILTVVTSPLKAFDYLISKFKTSQNIAFGFYYIGMKEI